MTHAHRIELTMLRVITMRPDAMRYDPMQCEFMMLHEAVLMCQF